MIRINDKIARFCQNEKVYYNALLDYERIVRKIYTVYGVYHFDVYLLYSKSIFFGQISSFYHVYAKKIIPKIKTII